MAKRESAVPRATSQWWEETQGPSKQTSHMYQDYTLAYPDLTWPKLSQDSKQDEHSPVVFPGRLRLPAPTTSKAWPVLMSCTSWSMTSVLLWSLVTSCSALCLVSLSAFSAFSLSALSLASMSLLRLSSCFKICSFALCGPKLLLWLLMVSD